MDNDLQDKVFVLHDAGKNTSRNQCEYKFLLSRGSLYFTEGVKFGSIYLKYKTHSGKISNHLYLHSHEYNTPIVTMALDS